MAHKEMVDKPVSVAWRQMPGEPDKGTDPTDLSVPFFLKLLPIP